MAFHQERWLFILRRDKVAIPRRIKEAVRYQTVFGWKFDCLRLRNIARIDLNVVCPAQHPGLARCEIKFNDRIRLGRRAGAKHRTPGRGAYETDVRELSLDLFELARRDINRAKMPDTPFCVSADDFGG